MAVSIRNVEKFLDDHPEYGSQKDKILSGLRNKLGDQKTMGAAVAEETLGTLATEFFQEVTTNVDHIRIGLSDLETG